ncbi:MAG: hypothetical protein JRI68_03670 [Deltaproteobacteria bacterium]|nr:hypothetical protein [Deltaproteobacteria bacterium]
MKVVIIGAGMGGRSIAHILLQDPSFQLAGFVGSPEEDAQLAGEKIIGDAKMLGDHTILPSLPKNDVVGFVVGIADNSVREKVFYEAQAAGLLPICAVSRHAIVEPSVRLGRGVVISPGCVLGYKVSVGDNSLVGAGTILDVGTQVGENCYFYAGCRVGGEVEIGRNAAFGVGAVVEPFRKIGKNQKVQAGQVVSADLESLVRSHG